MKKSYKHDNNSIYYTLFLIIYLFKKKPLFFIHSRRKNMELLIKHLKHHLQEKSQVLKMLIKMHGMFKNS